MARATRQRSSRPPNSAVCGTFSNCQINVDTRRDDAAEVRWDFDLLTANSRNRCTRLSSPSLSKTENYHTFAVTCIKKSKKTNPILKPKFSGCRCMCSRPVSSNHFPISQAFHTRRHSLVVQLHWIDWKDKKSGKYLQRVTPHWLIVSRQQHHLARFHCPGGMGT